MKISKNQVEIAVSQVLVAKANYIMAHSIASYFESSLIKFEPWQHARFFKIIILLTRVILDPLRCERVKSVDNKDKNNYYYNMFLEKGSYQDKSNTHFLNEYLYVLNTICRQN